MRKALCVILAIGVAAATPTIIRSLLVRTHVGFRLVSKWRWEEEDADFWAACAIPIVACSLLLWCIVTVIRCFENRE
jgi:hypothetical protein